MWFETHTARAYRRLDNVGEALKFCHQVTFVSSAIEKVKVAGGTALPAFL